MRRGRRRGTKQAIWCCPVCYAVSRKPRWERRCRHCGTRYGTIPLPPYFPEKRQKAAAVLEVARTLGIEAADHAWVRVSFSPRRYRVTSRGEKAILEEDGNEE